MAERFQPKAVQAPEVPGVKDTPAPSRAPDISIRRTAEFMSREEEIRLGQQMDAGRRLIEKAQIKLKEKAEFEPSEKERIEKDVILGEQQRIDARNQLVEPHIPIAKILAKKFVRSTIDYEDLYQHASEALVKAGDRFDWTKGVRFSTFANKTISGELKHMMRDNEYRPMNVPRPLKDNYHSVYTAAEKLTQDLQRNPTHEEIGKDLKKSPREVRDIFQAMVAEKSVKSLNETFDDSFEEVYELHDPNVLSEDEIAERMTIRKILTPNVETDLDERSKLILRRRFYDEWTQSQVGSEIGNSQMYVSRLEAKALAKMRELLNPQDSE